MAEYWDIFDMDRRSTGRQHLRGTPMADGDYHLVVNIWVVNSAGQVLLTQRHPDIPFGLKWACTGGSAITGEDTLTAALRETVRKSVWKSCRSRWCWWHRSAVCTAFWTPLWCAWMSRTARL